MSLKTGLYLSLGLVVCCASAFAQSSGDTRSIIDEINQVVDQPGNVAAQQAQPLLWEHNGSTFYLVAQGHSRKCFYKEPRAGMLSASAKPGSLVFQGEATGERYDGTAYQFNSRCGPSPYHVSGPILDEYRRVELHGSAPRVDNNCRITSTVDELLEFQLIEPTVQVRAENQINSYQTPPNDNSVSSSQSVPPQQQPVDPSAWLALGRVALVIGEKEYLESPLPTGINDAAIVADALRTAGFDVIDGADLDPLIFRESLNNFIEKLVAAGPDGIAVVYLSGRAAQINGENIFLPIGTKLDSATDARFNGFRIADLIGAMKAAPGKARVIVIDTGAVLPSLAKSGNLSPGLALTEAPEGFAIAYNHAPNTVAIDAPPDFSPFAKAFVEAIQEPFSSSEEFFSILRVRVHAETEGRQTPWSSDRLGAASLTFFATREDKAITKSAFKFSSPESNLASLPVAEAYKAVIAHDTISGYQKFITAFPDDPATARIQYNLAARREALLWTKAMERNAADAYWTYLDTYPDGAYARLARQKLTVLGASSLPPSGFSLLSFPDLPPPMPGEIVASSLSMPAVALPPPPLRLPPMPAAIAAITATPMAAPTRGRLPHLVAPIITTRPSWAAPPMHSQPRPVSAPMSIQRPIATPPALQPGHSVSVPTTGQYHSLTRARPSIAPNSPGHQSTPSGNLGARPVGHPDPSNVTKKPATRPMIRTAPTRAAPTRAAPSNAVRPSKKSR